MDVKTTFYKTLNTIVETDRVDNEEAYIINDYVSRLEATIKDDQQEIEKLTRQIDIMQKYFQLIIDIGFDYDGYRKAENLMELIDELVEYAYEGKIADDHTCHMIDGDGNKYNILGEKIEEEDK